VTKPSPASAQYVTSANRQPADALLYELSGATFIVIDFEGLTPAGRPPEPVEVAAIALACRGGQLAESGRFTELMRPPVGVPVTGEFTRITAITGGMLSGARPACQVMADLEGQLMEPGRCRLVAHSAPTEAGLLAGQRDHCPRLVATPLLDTVRLARPPPPACRHTDSTACSATTVSPVRRAATGRCPTPRSPLRSSPGYSPTAPPPLAGRDSPTWTSQQAGLPPAREPSRQFRNLCS